MAKTELAISGIKRDLLDVSTINERDYLPGDCEITVTQWMKDMKYCYFAKSTATVFLHWLPPSVQEQWQRFEDGVIAHLKGINAQEQR